MNVFSVLKPEFHPVTPEELLSHPPDVFRAIDKEHAELLREVFGIATVGDMVQHPVLDWIWRTFEVFKTGTVSGPPEEGASYIREDWRNRPCGEWLGSPPSSLEAISEEDGLRLSRSLHWTTVRNMASDVSFEAARVLSRMATGEPVSPAESIPKPLNNYFSGATNRYINRIRENEGRPPIPPPPPQAPAGDVPGLGLPLGASGSGAATTGPEAESFTDAGFDDGSRESSGSYREAFGQLQPHTRKDYTPSGAYIPKGGGSRGWFENQGVAWTERSNNYRYQEAIDSVGYRDVDVEHKIHMNLRGAERKELRTQVRFSTNPDEVPQPALCLDVSLTGTRIRLGRRLKEQSPVFIAFVHRDDIRGTVTSLVELEANVVWCREVNPNYKVPRYDIGLTYANFGIDTKERVSMLMMEQFEELLATAPPSEQEG